MECVKKIVDKLNVNLKKFKIIYNPRVLKSCFLQYIQLYRHEKSFVVKC